MPLQLPRLDDRDFAELMRAAEDVIRSRCPQWTDLSPGDPGTTLLEAFAYLTDVLLYRLNRVPEKVYLVLLNLLGVTALPPSAAEVRLHLTLSRQEQLELRLPAGHQVTDASGSVVFTFIEECVLQPGTEGVDARAIHGEPVEGELVGLGTGEGAQSVRLRRPPVLRRAHGIDTVVIAVEDAAPLPGAQAGALHFGGKTFAVWTEVPSFQPLAAENRVFVIDRTTGTIIFAPLAGLGPPKSAPAHVPGRGQEIRAWYWRGGGRAGNVAADTLTILRPSLPNVLVTNPARAAGGEDAETLDETIRRSQATVSALRTAVTARDFERVALESGGVGRAHAFAQRERWSFAEAGVVEVQLVPAIGPEARGENGAISLDILHAHQVSTLLDRVNEALAFYRPLGVRTVASWTRCRPVGVSTRVYVSQVEKTEAVLARITGRINELLQPTGTWPFGRSLHASHIYERILAEPGVRYAEGIKFRIEAGPESLVRDLARDPSNPRCVLAGTDNGLYRTLDFGRSWSLQDEGLPETKVVSLSFDPETPGLVAAVLANADAPTWTVCVSSDLGEHWTVLDRIQGEQVYSTAWVSRDGRPRLMLGTRRALRRLEHEGAEGSVIIGQLRKAPGNGETAGVIAIASMRHPSGTSYVAVARTGSGGVLISREGSEAGSFDLLPGSLGKDVRVLVFQRDGDRTFLWAGLAAEGGERGEGLMRVEARADGIDLGGWTQFGKGWDGGSCEGIDFAGPIVLAGTNRAGVLTLDLSAAATDQVWRAPALDCGLPIQVDRRALVPISGVAATTGSDGRLAKLLAGTNEGLFESNDGLAYKRTGQTEFTEEVPLPEHWLYCSGEHEITVAREQDGSGR